MEPGIDRALAAAFEAEEQERCRQGALIGAVIGIPVVSLFGLYDAAFYPDHLPGFLAMRGLVVAAATAAIVLLRRPFGHRHARAIAGAVALLLALVCIVMTVVTGGRSSPYYGGVNLVLLAVSLLLPWPPVWSAAASIVLIAAYVTAAVATQAFADSRILFHNLFFLGTTGAVALASTVFQRRVRWREFRTRTELELALAHKREFLASMSHELRTPLHVIIGYANMLLDDAAVPSKRHARDLAERVHDRGVFLHRMISDLLDLSKIEAGRMEIRPVRVQVDDLIELVAAGFAPLAEQKGLALQLHRGAGVRTIASDPQRLEQILSNFVANAIKFTARGAITIETRVVDGLALAAEGYRFLDEDADGDDPVLMLAVHDTGIGIRAADLGRLAEDFRQLDEAVDGRYGGTGLGLSIARKMADLLDGRIAVRSAHGRGSTFALVLPLPAARQRAAA